MDLSGAGAFKDPGPWALLKQRLPLYQEVYNDPEPYRPDVAVIVDERAKFYVKSDWDAFYWSLIDFRNQCGKSGAAVGYYLMDDFTAGIVPKCKAYIFPNAFSLTDTQIESINARLNKEKSTSIWIYAPGYIGPNGGDTARCSRVTGITLNRTDGRVDSIGCGVLDGCKWASDLTLSPRLTVTESGVKVLGHYADGTVSSAMKRVDGHNSIFLGSLGVSSEVLTRLLDLAKVQIWTRDGSVVQTDGKFLVIHSGKKGLKPIYLPEGVTAESLNGKIVRQSGNVIYADFAEGGTLWFRLSRRK
jgi:hypothetical protein